MSLHLIHPSFCEISIFVIDVNVVTLLFLKGMFGSLHIDPFPLYFIPISGFWQPILGLARRLKSDGCDSGDALHSWLTMDG